MIKKKFIFVTKINCCGKQITKMNAFHLEFMFQVTSRMRSRIVYCLFFLVLLPVNYPNILSNKKLKKSPKAKIFYSAHRKNWENGKADNKKDKNVQHLIFGCFICRHLHSLKNIVEVT